MVALPNAGAAEPPIVAVAFAPDGKSIVIGSQRGIERRSWPDLRELDGFPCEMPHVHDLAYSPQGDVLAIVGGSPAESGAIQFLSWPAGKSRGTFRCSDDLLYQVAWRSDGQQLAMAGGDGNVVLADRAGKVIRNLTGHSRGVLGVTYLDQTPHLVSVGLDQTVRVWDATTGTSLRQMNQHTEAVRDVAVKPGDRSGRHVLATASDDGTVRLWWPLVGRLVRFARLESPAMAIEWSPDGEFLLATCRDGHLRVIDPDRVQVTIDLPVAEGWLYSLAAAPDKQSAVVGGADGVLKRISYETN